MKSRGRAGRDNRNLQTFGRKTKTGDHLGYTEIDGRIILKWILKKEHVKRRPDSNG
jgi:hypothetical protein